MGYISGAMRECIVMLYVGVRALNLNCIFQLNSLVTRHCTSCVAAAATSTHEHRYDMCHLLDRYWQDICRGRKVGRNGSKSEISQGQRSSLAALVTCRDKYRATFKCLTENMDVRIQCRCDKFRRRRRSRRSRQRRRKSSTTS